MPQVRLTPQRKIEDERFKSNVTHGHDEFHTHAEEDKIGSAGWFSGGGLTASGTAGAIDIAAGTGLFRASTVETDPLHTVSWRAFTAVAIPSSTIRYVYMDWNGGFPLYSLSSDEFLEAPNKILLGVAINDAGVIDSAFNVGVRLQESIGQAGRFLRRVLSIQRDARRGGLIFGQTGAQKVTVSAGHLWWGRTDYTQTAKDYNASGNFDAYWQDGSGGFTEADRTSFDNTHYDNGSGTLATLTNTRWTTQWFYLEPDDHVVMVYGRNQFVTKAGAEGDSPPSTLPNRLQATGVLAARFVFQKSDATASISSAFDVTFTPSNVLEVNDTPVDGASSTPISSNWAFDHVAAADPHTGYTVMASGQYTGNDTVDRAIPHGLGSAPLLITLFDSSNLDKWYQEFGIVINYNIAGAIGFHIVQVPDGTNFYVGDAASYPQSANANTVVYVWVAWR